MAARIGIDTGGTFTDIVAVDDETGAIVTTKTPSTPADPAEGFLAGIEKVLAKLGESGDSIGAVSHGTTVATNKLLEGKTLYTDAWVVDKPWLTTLFYEAKMEMKFSVSPLEMILSEEQMARWHETKDRILAGVEKHRHRASFDAWLIQETYKKTLEDAPS